MDADPKRRTNGSHHRGTETQRHREQRKKDKAWLTRIERSRHGDAEKMPDLPFNA